jgi:hypothetical protein
VVVGVWVCVLCVCLLCVGGWGGYRAVVCVAAVGGVFGGGASRQRVKAVIEAALWGRPLKAVRACLLAPSTLPQPHPTHPHTRPSPALASPCLASPRQWSRGEHGWGRGGVGVGWVHWGGEGPLADDVVGPFRSEEEDKG